MTLILKPDIDITKMYMYINMKFLALVVQKFQPEQIDTQMVKMKGQHGQ